jgi:SAM-dependent methyltransferase
MHQQAKDRINQAIAQVTNDFPFPGYMIPEIVFGHGKYSNIAATAERYLQPGSRILDFGCGPCDVTAVLQHLDYKCSGTDDLNDIWHQEPENLAKIKSFIEASKIDFAIASESKLPFQPGSFDMVMLNDVLEHLHDSPRELLNRLLELLSPRGLLLITVPNAVNVRKRLAVLCGKTNLPPFSSYFWYQGQWRGHIREYVRSDLIQLAEFLDLEILELRGCDHMLDKVPPILLRPYLLLTRYFDSLKDSWLLVARKKEGWRPAAEPAKP